MPTHNLSLSVLQGPPIPDLTIPPGPARSLGRSSKSSLRLDHQAVSRHHAIFSTRSGRWTVEDAGSRHGTLLNAVTLDAAVPTPLDTGDRLRIAPWTFLVRVGEAPPAHPPTLIAPPATDPPRTIPPSDGTRRSHAAMMTLLECTSSINAAESPATLVDALLKSLRRLGFDRGAILTRTGSRTADLDLLGATAGFDDVRISETLLALTTESGEVSEAPVTDPHAPRRPDDAPPAPRRALCAPVRLDEAIWGYLYTDSSTPPDAPAEKADLLRSLAEYAASALARINRAELRRRLLTLEAEMSLAARARRMLMPPAEGRLACLRYASISIARGHVGGDIFDVIPLHPDRAAVLLGDVSGKGLASAIITALTQAFLHARLGAGDRLANAIDELNAHLCARIAEDQFVTLWTGIFDRRRRTVEYVDAGHACAALATPAGDAERLAPEKGGLVLGVECAERYRAHTTPLPPAHRLVVFSDALVRQTSSTDRRFGFERVLTELRRSRTPESDITRLLAALHAHADEEPLADDLSIASVQFIED